MNIVGGGGRKKLSNFTVKRNTAGEGPDTKDRTHAFSTPLSRLRPRLCHRHRRPIPRTNMQQPTLTAPVDKLKLVTAYPKARATMNDARLRTLAPAGTPIVLHLYTG